MKKKKKAEPESRKPSGRDSTKLYVDWDVPLRYRVVTIARPANTHQKLLHELTYPLSMEYSGTVPSIFLYLLPSLNDIKKEKIIVARDGAIPLVLFFQKHKTPKGLTGKIAVHEDLLSWVPPAWQEAIISYRLVSTTKSLPIDSVFIYGLNSSAMMSQVSCDAALQKSASFIKQAKKRYLYLPSFYFSRNEPVQAHAEIARRIFAAIGTDIEVVEWGRFLFNRDLSGCHIINLNKNTVIADPWLTHALMKIGATLGSPALNSNELLFLLSRSHGIAVQMEPKFPLISTAKRATEAEALFSSFESIALNWNRISTSGAHTLKTTERAGAMSKRNDAENPSSINFFRGIHTAFT